MAAIVYTPEEPPRDLADDLSRYLSQEFSRVALTFGDPKVRFVDTTTVAPVKPRAGEIRLADGTGWNPGAGAGFYGYYGGAWVKLG